MARRLVRWAKGFMSILLGGGILLPSFAQGATLSQIAQLRVPSYSWAGAYFGVLGGYGLTYIARDKAQGNVQPSFGNTGSFLFGLYTGFNMEVGQQAVVGAETDYGINRTIGVGSNSSILKQNWSGATRARFGYAFDNLLPYIAGGIVYTHFLKDANFLAKGNNMVGWTLGAGLDYALTEGVILRADYRYNDYGPVDTSVLSKASSNNLLTIHSNSFYLGISYKF